MKKKLLLDIFVCEEYRKRGGGLSVSESTFSVLKNILWRPRTTLSSQKKLFDKVGVKKGKEIPWNRE